MKKIDVAHWNRRNHFEFYKDFTDPCFNICVSVDVSVAVRYAREHKLSVFLTLLYLSNKATNAVEAFRRRLDSEQNVWLVDCTQPSATVLKADETFNFCDFIFSEDLHDFVLRGREKMQQALSEPGLANVTNLPEQIFYSVIPWLEFTSYKHAANAGFNHVPKIVFGKITAKSAASAGEERLMMPVSVELSHVLADGLDIAKYIAAFEKNIQHLS
ncbi:hypothetical protein SG34_015605 [Thalassomonas viridans]|uniref:Chloramphenicol acetyltransferase n=1 Tax=Thalassomonas viridans TaxID=137584 RepID=A0AAE9YYQ6_9GAMM|nr:CatA-like O-acetyltransferase [Thalassomonas viridans]WDE02870.1 hypothetical protein SG34_015605 [Thalassomonas viridans]